VNWRGPVIDLDRTPLDEKQMRQVAARICEVHQAAYGESKEGALPSEAAAKIVTGVSEARFRIAKPRLLSRVVVDLLERRRIDGTGKMPNKFDDLIGSAASQIMKEASL
jgi:hypothetical protein